MSSRSDQVRGILLSTTPKMRAVLEALQLIPPSSTQHKTMTYHAMPFTQKSSPRIHAPRPAETAPLRQSHAHIHDTPPHANANTVSKLITKHIPNISISAAILLPALSRRSLLIAGIPTNTPPIHAKPLLCCTRRCRPTGCRRLIALVHPAKPTPSVRGFLRFGFVFGLLR